MKKRAITLLFVLVLAVGVVGAQSTEPVNFRTPFAFVVGDQQVPAGAYTVRVISSPGVLSFRSVDGNISLLINSFPIQRQETADKYQLIFHRYGDRYYVSEIWTPGYRTGRMMAPQSTELELAKSQKPQHVVVNQLSEGF